MALSVCIVALTLSLLAVASGAEDSSQYIQRISSPSSLSSWISVPTRSTRVDGSNNLALPDPEYLADHSYVHSNYGITQDIAAFLDVVNLYLSTSSCFKRTSIRFYRYLMFLSQGNCEYC